MGFLRAIFFQISVLISSCNQSDKPIIRINPGETVQTSSCSDAVTSDFYNFLKIVINKLNLDTTYGLEEYPLKNLNSIESDTAFLQKHQLIAPARQKTGTSSYNISTLGVIDRCLTKDDIQYMLKQKNNNTNFKWNRQCVNLKNTNKFDDKYQFSIPLSTKDKTKFIITIENYNAGGMILLYKKENNDWILTVERQWLH